ncbi:hypothetical protein Tco_0378472 [Tanacetum coccineum]
MIGREILGSFCVNYFECELLKEENPPEQSRLGIFISKEIFKGGMIRMHNAFVQDEVRILQKLQKKVKAGQTQTREWKECTRAGSLIAKHKASDTRNATLAIRVITIVDSMGLHKGNSNIGKYQGYESMTERSVYPRPRSFSQAYNYKTFSTHKGYLLLI